MSLNVHSKSSNASASDSERVLTCKYYFPVSRPSGSVRRQSAFGFHFPGVYKNLPGPFFRAICFIHTDQSGIEPASEQVDLLHLYFFRISQAVPAISRCAHLNFLVNRDRKQAAVMVPASRPPILAISANGLSI